MNGNLKSGRDVGGAVLAIVLQGLRMIPSGVFGGVCAAGFVGLREV